MSPVSVCPMDLFILLDSSGSDQARFDQAHQLAMKLVESLKVGPQDVRVSFLNYAGKEDEGVEMLIDRKTDAAGILNEIQQLKMSSQHQSCTDKALTRVREQLTDHGEFNTNQAVIVLSNGVSCGDIGAQADQLISRGAKIYTLFVTDDNGRTVPYFGDQLLQITRNPDRIFTACQFPDFLKLFMWENCGRRFATN